MAGGLTFATIESALGATGQAGSFVGTAVVAIAMIAIFFVVFQIGLHFGLERVKLDGRGKLFDRIGGGVFGAVRGLLLVGLGYLGYTYYLDEARHPESVQNAMTRPAAAAVAQWFESFAPESSDLQQTLDGQQEDQVDAAANGYGREDRSALSEIVTTVTTSSPDADATNTDQQGDQIADVIAEENN